MWLKRNPPDFVRNFTRSSIPQELQDKVSEVVRLRIELENQALENAVNDVSFWLKRRKRSGDIGSYGIFAGESFLEGKKDSPHIRADLHMEVHPDKRVLTADLHDQRTGEQEQIKITISKGELVT